MSFLLSLMPGWGVLSRILAPLIVVVAVAGSIWGYGHYQFKRGEAVTEARYISQRLESEQEDRRIEQRRTSTSQEIQDGYAKKATRARADASAARSELDGLRSDLAAREGEGSDASAASGTDGTAIFRELLGECAARYTGVAQAADEANGRLAALQSWVTGVCLDAEPSRPAQ